MQLALATVVLFLTLGLLIISVPCGIMRWRCTARFGKCLRTTE